MKKYLAVLFLSVFIIPSVALASWWNPFSWNIFHKKEISIPIQTTNIEKIAESQKQQPTTTTPKTKEVKKIVPVINNSAIIRAQVRANVDEQTKIDKEKVEAEKKQAQTLQQIQQNIEQIAQNTTPDVCSNIDGIQKITPSGMTKNSNNNCVPIVETYTIKKDGEIIKSKITLEEVRIFVKDLNNYVTWIKKSQTATIEELQDLMLSPNGYTLIKNK